MSQTFTMDGWRQAQYRKDHPDAPRVPDTRPISQRPPRSAAFEHVDPTATYTTKKGAAPLPCIEVKGPYTQKRTGELRCQRCRGAVRERTA